MDFLPNSSHFPPTVSEPTLIARYGLEFTRMSSDDRTKLARSDLGFLLLFLLLVLWTFRGVIVGTSDPFMSSLRNFEPWKSDLTRVDASRPESFADDPTTQTYPWAVYAHENLTKGDFPLWNTRMFSGTPFIANRLTGLFDPLTLLPVALLNPITGLSVFYFVHYLLAAWFMYLFLKSLGISRPVAAFGTIGYIFQGAYVPWMGFIVADKAYFPMSMYYLQRCCDRKDRVGIVGFIASFFLLTVNSYPQMVVFAVYIFIAWVLFTCGPGFRSAFRRILALVLMLFLISLLGAMQHLPMLEFYFKSLRAYPEFGIELASKTGLERYDSPLSLLAIFFPTLWGDYLTDPYSPLPQFVLRIYNHAYIGILAGFGFLFAPIVWRNRHARFFTVLSLLGLVFLAWDSFYMMIVRILPGFRISTVKPDFLTLTSMIIVASFVLDHLVRNLRANESLTRNYTRVYGWLLGAVVGMGFVIILWRVVPGFFAIEGAGRLMIVFGHLVFVWLACALLYFCTRGKMKAAVAMAGIIILAVVDLVPYHDHFMPLVTRGRTCFRTESIRFLEEKMQTEGPFRIFRDRTIVLAPNTPMLYDLDEPGGFDSFVSADYAHFFRSIDPAMSRNSRTLDLPGDYVNYRQPFWSFLGIRYLLSPGPMPALPPPWEPAFEGDLYIYENTEWLPRWFLVPSIIPVESVEDGYHASQAIDPSREAVVVGIDHIDIPPALLESPSEAETPGSLELRHYGADELRVGADCSRDCFMVFSDTYFHGWRAWVDKKEVEIYRTDGIVKGIVVPQGTHEIRFLYDPGSYKLGWLLALVGLILTAFAVRPIAALLSGTGDRHPDFAPSPVTQLAQDHGTKSVCQSPVSTRQQLRG